MRHEPVEVVDADGNVERIVSRAEMRAANLRHRATFVVIVDEHGAVLVHQRAAWKDIWPSRWDIAFGGVCGVGETWLVAAERELAEEAGLVAELRDLGPVRYEDDATRMVGRVFTARHSGPPTFVDGEVVDHAWVPAAELMPWAGTHELCDDASAVVLPLVLQHLSPRTPSPRTPSPRTPSPRQQGARS